MNSSLFYIFFPGFLLLLLGVVEANSLSGDTGGKFRRQQPISSSSESESNSVSEELTTTTANAAALNGLPGESAQAGAQCTVYHDRDFRGSARTYSVDWNQCTNLYAYDNDQLSSVNTHDNCILLWEHGNCQGRNMRVAPGSGGHRYVGDAFNDITSSLSRC